MALAVLAERATAGLVAGADPSDVMARQARQRNRAAVRAGRMMLCQGSATALPFADASFTRACAIHALYFWAPLATALREAHRVLAPGRLVLAVRTQRPNAGRFDPLALRAERPSDGPPHGGLESVGFRSVIMQRRDLGRETIAAIVARR